MGKREGNNNPSVHFGRVRHMSSCHVMMQNTLRLGAGLLAPSPSDVQTVNKDMFLEVHNKTCCYASYLFGYDTFMYVIKLYNISRTDDKDGHRRRSTNNPSVHFGSVRSVSS